MAPPNTPSNLPLKIETERLRSGPETFDILQTPRSFDLVDDPEYTFDEPVTGAVTVRLVGTSTVLLQGTVRTLAKAPCARCLEGLRIPLAATANLVFMTDDRLRDPDKYPELVEDNTSWYDGDAIYPTEKLRELLLLELPGVTACELDANNICPVRGVKVEPFVFGPAFEKSEGAADAEDDDEDGKDTLAAQLRRMQKKLQEGGAEEKKKKR